MDNIFEDIKEEIKRQLEKWGVQNHPSLDMSLLNRKEGCTSERMCQEYEIPTENRAKFLCENASNRKELTWTHIVVEELSEAVCANQKNRREELVQLSAVIINWINCIDRHNGKI